MASITGFHIKYSHSKNSTSRLLTSAITPTLIRNFQEICHRFDNDKINDKFLVLEVTRFFSGHLEFIRQVKDSNEQRNISLIILDKNQVVKQP